MTNSEISTQVQNYKGNNGFISSLQGGLKKYGKLTERQLSAAGKFFSKVNTPKKMENTTQPKEINVNIKISKFIAKRVAEENDLEFKPFLITITKVLRETAKAYQVVGKMNTSDVSSCRCCGKDLTDWRSQATGVGPVCSKSLGIPYVRKEEDIVVYKKLLKLKIDKIGDLTFWLAKSQIKEGKEELNDSIK
jgi:hypothetical protein